MSGKWDWRIAYYWEMNGFGGTMRDDPPEYAKRENKEFLELLEEGWEPVTGWGHAGGSSLRSHVVLKKKVSV